MGYKAFVSSTFEDLKEHRATVIAALRQSGIHVDPMEDWTAASAEPKQFSQDRLKDCDLCVLLVAFRRGHVPEGETLSITQLEYEAARRSGLDILVYMLGEDERWYRRFDELEKDPALKAWRAELMERHGVKFFGSDAASIKIEPAIVRQLLERPGRPSGNSRPPSNVPTRGTQPFVGRDNDIPRILARFDADPPPRAVVLTGPPGVGKSELAREYARLNASRYAGGTFVVNCDVDGPPVDLATIGSVILRLPLANLSLEDQCLATLHALGSKPTLLILDNARTAASVEKWLPVAGQYCHALITSTLSYWGAAFDAYPVEPLDFDESAALTRTIGPQIPERFAAALAEWSGGLPQQICSQAAALDRDAAFGRLELVSIPMPLAPALVTSYRRAYNQLEPQARLLLHAAMIFRPYRIPSDDLCRTVISVTGDNLSSVTRWLDACRDLYLLAGQDELNMHQLLKSFVGGEKLDQSSADQLAGIRQRQWQRFLHLAKTVGDDPVKLTSVQSLSAFSSDLTTWDLATLAPTIGQLRRIGTALAEMGQFAAARPWFERAVEATESMQGAIDHYRLGTNLHQVGYCLANLGEFAAARPWYQRAVEAKARGDAHGRIDHDSLGRSFGQVGYCLTNLGEFVAARRWYERAVAALQKGDVYGRVNHESLGRSLHLLGYCLSSLGEFSAARPWYEQAVKAAEQGDMHGRIDYESLGSSLHQIGYCLASLDEFAAAQPWYEQAVKAKEKGDVHRRVDYGSLGKSLRDVGYCLSSLGKFAAAQMWYERAVEAKMKGDVYGRIDHDSLGWSLHQVGYCLSSLGEYAAAKPWYERAVEASEKGDVHGRINHESVGGSLHQVGHCLLQLTDFAAAQTWYERAAAAAEEGDVHGRIDHDSLGKSLAQVGYCLLKLADFGAAQTWYQRAVQAKEKGDVHGHVNYGSLAATLWSTATCLREIGESNRADEMEARARQLDNR